MKGERDAMRKALGERVIYALLRPAARVALSFGIPMRQLRDRLQMAYFQEARGRGLKLHEIAHALDVSPRTAALLSKQLKENFLDVESEVGLPRKIEYLLWAEPLSSARLKQVLVGVDPDEIDEALQRLMEEGRVTQDDRRRWAVVRTAFRLVDERGWLSRLDGLDTLLATVGQTAWARFFGGPLEQARSLARNLALRVRGEDVAKLRELYEETIWPLLAALDERARGAEDSLEVDVAFLFSPRGP